MELNRTWILGKAGTTKMQVFVEQPIRIINTMPSCSIHTPRGMSFAEVTLRLPKNHRGFDAVKMHQNEISWCFEGTKTGGFGFSRSESEILNFDNVQISFSEDKRVCFLKITYRNNIRPA